MELDKFNKNTQNPNDLHGKDIMNKTMQLMNDINPEINKEYKRSVVELTKKGPDGKIYGIVKEDNKHYIKIANIESGNILKESDFQYLGAKEEKLNSDNSGKYFDKNLIETFSKIAPVEFLVNRTEDYEDNKLKRGLKNIKEGQYSTYKTAIKQLNLWFLSLARENNLNEEINVFVNDNLVGKEIILEEQIGEIVEKDLLTEEVVETKQEIIEENANPIENYRISGKGISLMESLGENLDSNYKVPDNISKLLNLNEETFEELKKKIKFPEIQGEGSIEGFEVKPKEYRVGEEKYQGWQVFSKGREIFVVLHDHDKNKYFYVQTDKKDNKGFVKTWTEITKVVSNAKIKDLQLPDKHMYWADKQPSMAEGSLEETNYKLKLPNSQPQTQQIATQGSNQQPQGGNSNQPSQNNEQPPQEGNDNPFDKEPFDAGVDVSEEEDPKKFIQKLSGKIGQSLRTYNKNQGNPDFELEKFVINSVLSATHTSEMDQSDQKDIIDKVKNAGTNDNNNKNSNDNDNNDSDNSSSDNNNGGGSDKMDNDKNQEDDNDNKNQNESEQKLLKLIENRVIQELQIQDVVEDVLKEIENSNIKNQSKDNIEGSNFEAPKISMWRPRGNKNPNVIKKESTVPDEIERQHKEGEITESINEAKTVDKNIIKLVDEANKYIQYAKNKEFSAVETESTWESVYDYQPVEVKNQFVYVTYTEPYEKNKVTKEKYNVNNFSSLDELKYELKHIVKCIKKGYKLYVKESGKVTEAINDNTPIKKDDIPEINNEFNLRFATGSGYYDVTKYPYGGDFKRFNGTESGKLIKGPVKMGDQIRAKLKDGREIVVSARAVDSMYFDELLEKAKEIGVYVN